MPRSFAVRLRGVVFTTLHVAGPTRLPGSLPRSAPGGAIAGGPAGAEGDGPVGAADGGPLGPEGAGSVDPAAGGSCDPAAGGSPAPAGGSSTGAASITLVRADATGPTGSPPLRAVTSTRIVFPRSAGTSSYEPSVAPGIAVQPPDAPAQRCHTYENVIG